MTGEMGDRASRLGAGVDPQVDFCALEQRYRPMVYGAALRSVGCPETAGEVTQDVFLLLARKGMRLPAEHVCGWLHRAAVLKSRERLRGERRYLRRVAEYARRADSDASASSADPLLDRLDAALDALSDVDRRVIFLRYFEGLNAAEIAARLGLTVEAAQKKCERARARLAEKLAAGGLLTVAAAHIRAGELLQQAAGEAPPLRLTSRASQGLAAVPRRLLWGAAAGLVTGIVVYGVLEWRPPSSGRSYGDQTKLVPAPPSPPVSWTSGGLPATGTAPAPAAASLADVDSLDLLTLASLLEQADGGDLAAGAEAEMRLRQIDVEALHTAASAVPALPASPNQLRVLALGLVRHLTTRDPRRAVLVGESFWRAQHGASAPVLSALVQEALWAWSKDDAAAARAWYDGIASEGLFEDRGEEAPGMTAEDFSGALALHAVAGDLDQRVATAERLCLRPQPADPAWLAMVDVWAHKLTPVEARTLADALWQHPAVPRDAAFALRLALVTLPTSAPDEASLHWAATPHGALTPDPALAAAVATAWHRRHPTTTLPHWMKPHLPPSPTPKPVTNH